MLWWLFEFVPPRRRKFLTLIWINQRYFFIASGLNCGASANCRVFTGYIRIRALSGYTLNHFGATLLWTHYRIVKSKLQFLLRLIRSVAILIIKPKFELLIQLYASLLHPLSCPSTYFFLLRFYHWLRVTPYVALLVLTEIAEWHCCVTFNLFL